MNLTGLRYFLALAEAASFTRAAARLNVTQPTLSTAIARLEEQLGAKLFERDRKRISLTPAGQRFVGRAQAMLGEWRQAQADLAGTSPPQRLRIGLLPTLPVAVLEGLPVRLQRLRQRLDLELHEGSPAILASRLRQGTLDFALTALEGGADGLESHLLLREPYRLGIAAGNLLSTRERCSVSDLAAMPFLIRARCEVGDHARKVFAEHGIRPGVLLRTPCEETVASMVAADLGACFLPESLARGGMALLAVDELPLVRRLALAWRADLASETVELAREAAEGLRWRSTGRGRTLGFAH